MVFSTVVDKNIFFLKYWIFDNYNLAIMKLNK